jgi:drug/metabolite transporter (DMT)-like permease
MIQCTQPILTALCAFLLLREKLGLEGVVGAAIIIGSILFLNLMEEKERKDSTICVAPDAS